MIQIDRLLKPLALRVNMRVDGMISLSFSPKGGLLQRFDCQFEKHCEAFKELHMS